MDVIKAVIVCRSLNTGIQHINLSIENLPPQQYK